MATDETSKLKSFLDTDFEFDGNTITSLILSALYILFYFIAPYINTSDGSLFKKILSKLAPVFAILMLLHIFFVLFMDYSNYKFVIGVELGVIFIITCVMIFRSSFWLKELK